MLVELSVLLKYIYIAKFRFIFRPFSSKFNRFLREFRSRRMKESEVLCLCIGILLSVILITLPNNVVDSALVEFPSNTAVTNTTNSIKFRCRSDELYELQWFMQANNTDHRQTLAFADEIKNEQAKSYSSIENEEAGKFTLILSIQDESAQTYTCQEPDTEQERSAELIIMEPIKFEGSINESHVTLNCSVNFRGNWAPELELSHNGTSVVDRVNVFVVPNHNVSTTLIFPHNNNSAFAGNHSCTTRFHLRGKPKQTTDNSVPSYMDTSTLTVHMEEIREAEVLPEQPGSVLVLLVLIVVLIGLLAGLIWKVHKGAQSPKKRCETEFPIALCVDDLPIPQDALLSQVLLKESDSGHSGQQDPKISTVLLEESDSGHSGQQDPKISTVLVEESDSGHSGQQDPKISTGSSAAGIDSGCESLYTPSVLLEESDSGHSGQQDPKISTVLLEESDSGHSGQQDPKISTESLAENDSGYESLSTSPRIAK